MQAVTIANGIETVSITDSETRELGYYLGYYDRLGFIQTTGRRARPTASPDFTLWVTNRHEERVGYPAAIVASNIPEGGCAIDDGLAIAAVTIDDEEWYAYLSREIGSGAIQVADVLVSFEGQPEELFAMPHLFEVE